MFTDLGEAEGKKKDKINNQHSCNSIVFLPNRFSFSAIGKLNVVVRHITQGEVDGDPRCRLPGLPTTLTGGCRRAAWSSWSPVARLCSGFVCLLVSFWSFFPERQSIIYSHFGAKPQIHCENVAVSANVLLWLF